MMTAESAGMGLGAKVFLVLHVAQSKNLWLPSCCVSCSGCGAFLQERAQAAAASRGDVPCPGKALVSGRAHVRQII